MSSLPIKYLPTDKISDTFWRPARLIGDRSETCSQKKDINWCEIKQELLNLGIRKDMTIFAWVSDESNQSPMRHVGLRWVFVNKNYFFHANFGLNSGCCRVLLLRGTLVNSVVDRFLMNLPGVKIIIDVFGCTAGQHSTIHYKDPRNRKRKKK